MNISLDMNSRCRRDSLVHRRSIPARHDCNTIVTAGSYANTVIIIYRESITSIPLPVTSIIHAGTGMVSFLCRRVVTKKKGKKEK